MPDSNSFWHSSHQLVINFLITIYYFRQFSTKVFLLLPAPSVPSVSRLPSVPSPHLSHLSHTSHPFHPPFVPSVPSPHLSHLSHTFHPSHPLICPICPIRPMCPMCPIFPTTSDLLHSFSSVLSYFPCFFVYRTTISSIKINKQIWKPFKYRIPIQIIKYNNCKQKQPEKNLHR